jgi:hypothetical protein
MTVESPVDNAPPAVEVGPLSGRPQERKRPRLDLNVGERKRGKSIFGLVLGTLNKAKSEDKARAASESVRATSIPHIVACLTFT